MKVRSKNQNRRPLKPAFRTSKVSLLPAVIPVREQLKLTKKVALRCRRAWDTASQLKSEHERFYQQDERAYSSWYASAFSDECRKRDTLLAKCRELEGLILQIRREAAVSNIEFWQAYEKVTAPGYQFDPESQNRDGADSDEGFTFGAGGEDDFDVCDCVFCRMKREGKRMTGDRRSSSPDDDVSSQRMDPAIFEAMAEVMFERIFGGDFLSARERKEAFKVFRDHLAAETGFDDLRSKRYEQEQSELEVLSQADQEVTLLALYRSLAKHLHPDSVADYTDRHRDLWLLAQEAYRAKDVDELRKVTALVAMLRGVAAEGLSISDIQSAGTLLQHSNNKLRKQLRVLKKSPAWGFSTAAERERSQLLCIERLKLANQISQFEQDAQELERLLARYKNRDSGRIFADAGSYRFSF